MRSDSGGGGRRKRAAEPMQVDSSLLSNLLGYQLRLAMNAVTADLRLALEETSLRPALFAILAIVRGNPGIIQTAAGNALGIQRANFVPLLNELGDRKLVERRAAPQDKRAYALYLTGEGERVLDEALRRIHDHETRFFGRLSASERASLAKILARLSDKEA